MARLIRAAKESLYAAPSHRLLGLLPNKSLPRPGNAYLLPSQSATHSTTSNKTTRSLFQSNILRILHDEIDYQTNHAPLPQPETTVGSFTVLERPGEQRVMMRRRHNDAEDIKLEATMFDGCVTVPTHGEDEEVRLHITVLVDIAKEDGGDVLEFLCSAWPDCLEIQKVYLLGRNKMLGRPYMGPDFRGMNPEVQKRLKEYLEDRGVNDQLAFCLHDYMLNKDRAELIRWFGKIKNFVEK